MTISLKLKLSSPKIKKSPFPKNKHYRYSTVGIWDYSLGELEGILEFILQKKRLWSRVGGCLSGARMQGQDWESPGLLLLLRSVGTLKFPGAIAGLSHVNFHLYAAGVWSQTGMR